MEPLHYEIRENSSFVTLENIVVRLKYDVEEITSFGSIRGYQASLASAVNNEFSEGFDKQFKGKYEYEISSDGKVGGELGEIQCGLYELIDDTAKHVAQTRFMGRTREFVEQHQNSMIDPFENELVEYLKDLYGSEEKYLEEESDLIKNLIEDMIIHTRSLTGITSLTLQGWETRYDSKISQEVMMSYQNGRSLGKIVASQMDSIMEKS